MDCPFKATLHYSFKQDCLKFTSTSLQHNHPISQEIYNSYSQVTTRKIKMNPNAKHLQETLDKANCHTEVNMIDKDLTNIDQTPNLCCVLSMSSNGSTN